MENKDDQHKHICSRFVSDDETGCHNWEKCGPEMADSLKQIKEIIQKSRLYDEYKASGQKPLLITNLLKLLLNPGLKTPKEKDTDDAKEYLHEVEMKEFFAPQTALGQWVLTVSSVVGSIEPQTFRNINLIEVVKQADKVGSTLEQRESGEWFCLPCSKWMAKTLDPKDHLMEFHNITFTNDTPIQRR